MFYGAVGAVLGGRIGYVLFYNVSALATDPLYLLRIWEGGMAFHGGLLGVLVAMLLFARKTHRSFISITDFLAPLCPIGLGLGRLGNFINMELPGRVSESGFGLVYPCEVVYAISPMCRYLGICGAASFTFVSGVFRGRGVVYLVMAGVAQTTASGFCIGVISLRVWRFRLLTELFREPDAHIGFVLFGGVSMGQLLSLPLLIAGILLGLWSLQMRARQQHKTSFRATNNSH